MLGTELPPEEAYRLKLMAEPSSSSLVVFVLLIIVGPSLSSQVMEMILLPACMSVCHLCVPGVGAAGSCEPPCGCWELNPDLLEA